jgi:lysophospholipase L1-like esterase
MPLFIWPAVLCVTVVSSLALLVRRGRRDLAALVTFLNMLLLCTQVLLDPRFRTSPVAPLVVGLLILSLGAHWLPNRLELAVVGRMRRPSAKIAITLLAVSIIPLGSIELACRALTELKILKYHRAIQTVWRSGNDDWRLATIIEESREPDPVLLWRPVARIPFNSHRFKGPEFLDPKPADVFRVICYGDSLTDGPPKDSWPRWLEHLLQKDQSATGRRFEVLNAGVAGYSSYQGLLRFLQEVDRYSPDLLMVSFGWNDAAEAIGQPDKTFQIPPSPIVACQRALVQYRSYLVIMHYTRQWRAEPQPLTTGAPHPRVSVDDYLANMERFRIEAEARGIPIAFLTRPHKMPTTLLEKDLTWRGSVPAYNVALREWTTNRHLPLIDIERTFEALPPSLFSDECHFVPAGYQKMAEIVRGQLDMKPRGVLTFAPGPRPNLPAESPYAARPATPRF